MSKDLRCERCWVHDPTVGASHDKPGSARDVWTPWRDWVECACEETFLLWPALAVLALDQVTKVLIATRFALHETKP